MRSIVLAAAAVALAAPDRSIAQDPPPAPERSPRPPASAPSRPLPAKDLSRPTRVPAVAPAPPRGQRPGAPAVAPAPPRGTRVGPGGVIVVSPAPFWWGWGWGYGYYPLYPAPYAPPVGDAPPPERVSMKIAAAGASSGDGLAGGVSLLVEGRRAGMHASLEGVELSSSAILPGAAPALSLARVGATWAVASAPAFRVRLEAGGSMLSIPAAGAYSGSPYGGKTAFGPDVGLSGQLGLLGPLGVEAHARFTPWPVPVADVRTAAAMRLGPMAFTVGWRAIQVAGDGVDGPDGWFDGPELGVQARF